jgi:1-aminocyclopropane-1-carboxylate deaminase/D-cysteine desulfhydrase-like pyridoxal-dependent ACC family enzyme
VTDYPLHRFWPQLASRLPRAVLGDFPTPLERLEAIRTGGTPAYVKRDDLSSPIYGGNKVRTLETLFGAAIAAGQREILAVGAFGSNHALATVLHAPRVGLEPGAILFPQPESWAALENIRETLALARRLIVVPHWSLIPASMLAARRQGRAIMAPGGATPTGALGYVNAALELAQQLADSGLEPPRRLYLGIGSTCTTAGLLVGFAHAARRRLGFLEPPTVVAVRVTPWPVTSRFRVLSLARRTSRYLAELTGDAALELSAQELGARLEIDGSELGAGYGKPTPNGLRTIDWFTEHTALRLDTTYSAKSAAAFLRAVRARADGPHLFWSTKSTAPLPGTAAALIATPPRLLRWVERASFSLGAGRPR